MKRHKKIFPAAAGVIFCICLIIVIFLKRTGIKNYLDCSFLLSNAYSSDRIDMDISVFADTSLIDANVDFNAVKIPYGDSTAVKFTFKSSQGNIELYQIGQNSFLSSGERYTASELPEDFMALLKLGSKLYHSGYTIVREQNGKLIRYKVGVPGEEVADIMKKYGGMLGKMDIRYSNCTLIITAKNRELQSARLSGTLSYNLPAGIKISADMEINADVNALGADVEAFHVPEAIENISK